MNILFSPTAWDDYLYWQKHGKQLLKRVNNLIKDAMRNRYTGIGKPEPLKGKLSDFWSRRIDDEHRMVYRISDDDQQLEITQLRYHY